ncbi:hypothetical protein [Microbacterium aurugineum]
MHLPDAAVRVVAFAGDLDLVVLYTDDQFAEVRGQKVAADGVRGPLIEVARLAKQVDVRQRGVRAILEAIKRDVELLSDGFRLKGCRLDPLANLGDGQCASRGEFDQSFFLRLELPELLRQLRLRVAVRSEQIVDGVGAARPHPVYGVRREPFSGHYRHDFALDLLDP